MNIFAVDDNPVLAAQALHDKHVVKMCLETAQMLCTIARCVGENAPYRSTHTNHPCTVWARETASNARWLVEHGIALCDEYTFRYGREHACARVIHGLAYLPELLPDSRLTSFALAMPEDCKRIDPVESYRLYYIQHKLLGAWYTHRRRPQWVLDGTRLMGYAYYEAPL